MRLYRTICYKVEDLFVKALSKKQELTVVKEKVNQYRTEKEEMFKQRKLETEKKNEEKKHIQNQKRAEQDRQRREKEEQEKRELEMFVSNVMEIGNGGYSQYEYNEIKRNKPFFQSLIHNIYEQNEKAKSFIFCEFDKSSKKEIKGYLISTNKRVLFISKDFNHIEKFRYQTITNVNWFKDGVLERGLRIQYGKRKLEFDEMFDSVQMKRVGNTILTNSTTRAM